MHEETTSTIEKGSEESMERIVLGDGKRTTIRSFWPLLVIALAAIAIYSTVRLHVVESPAYQQKLLSVDTANTIKAVGKLIELPNETPQVATVTDADSLRKQQQFFLNAENGDAVLIFTNEAIIYRPSINKIINVAPVNYQSEGSAPSVPSTNASTGE